MVAPRCVTGRNASHRLFRSAVIQVARKSPPQANCSPIGVLKGTLPSLYEQVLHQQMGYALVMLWPELPDEDEDGDPDEDRTAKQRLAHRAGQRRW